MLWGIGMHKTLGLPSMGHELQSTRVRATNVTNGGPKTHT